MGNTAKSDAAILVFEDGQVFIQKECASPSRPIVVELEGSEPTAEQLEMLQVVYLLFMMVFGAFTLTGALAMLVIK